MRTLAEQVEDFMQWKELNATSMAALVSKHQQTPVIRQNITDVVKNGRKPRFLGAIAKAMGTDVETLEAGRWVRPGHEAPVPPTTDKDAALATLRDLNSMIRSSSPEQRKVISELLAGLAKDPDNDAYAQALGSLLSFPKSLS